MEELIYLIFQFLVQAVFEIAWWVPFEFLNVRRWFFILAGLIGGALSLLFRPEHIIVSVELRTVNLLVTPLVLAYFVELLGEKIDQFKRNKETEHTLFDHWLFFFLFALIRFVLAK